MTIPTTPVRAGPNLPDRPPRFLGLDVFRENSRCSQGTGNILRQLVERFSLTFEEACAQAATVTRPAVLSGRGPVILKSDLTHARFRAKRTAAPRPRPSPALPNSASAIAHFPRR